MTLSFGVQLPTVDGLRTGRFEIAEAARLAERLGFDSAWIGDHLALDAPVIESTVAAATAVAVTERLSIGFGILLAALRQPVWLAKQLSSLQWTSNGRIELGIGVGGEYEAEWMAAGVPMRERGRRTDVFLDALAQLMTGAPAHLPAPFSLDVPALKPAGAIPPLWIGGRSDVALRRAVRVGAGWLAVWVDPARVRAARERLDHLAADSGRPNPTIAVQILVNPNHDVAQARAEMGGFMQGIYGLPFARLERYTASGPLDSIAEQLSELVDAGATTLVLMPGSPRPVSDLEDFADIVGRVRAHHHEAQTTGTGA